MKVLGIDPGYERLGIAIVEKDTQGKERLLYSDCFKTSAKDPHYVRLDQIGTELSAVITKYQPDALAIENLFFNSNQKTALLVSEARGVILYTAAHAGLTIEEFTPPQIKAAITGNGRSDKKGIIKMVPLLIKIDKKIQYDDEYDAIAAALTYLATIRF